MNVFFDYQTFFQQKYGGISRYFCELITGINRTDQHHAHLSLLLSDNVHLHEYNLPVMDYPFPNGIRLYDKSNRLYNRLEAKIRNYDIYHATYFDDFLVPYIGSKPFLTTFYDMTYERLSDRFPELAAAKYIVDQKKRMAQRASHLIAISESTKIDMIELIDVPPEKITVIHLGSSFPQIDHNTYSGPVVNTQPYLLYVGNRSGYKNFNFFVQAIAPLLKRLKIHLVCAGGGNFTQQEKNLIQSEALDKFIHHKNINDLILRDLYKGAVAFVFPSLYEGFGLPILEAFACNCPCILSNISSLPEIAGNAALYMDPTNSESIAHNVEKVISDTDLRHKLIRSGAQQLLKFSWQRTVDETLNLYNKFA